MKKSSVKIIKVPGEKSPQYRQEFVSQPINYLKIIENTEKVKYDHLNRDYQPMVDDKSLAGRKLDFPNPDLPEAVAPSSPSSPSTPPPPVPVPSTPPAPAPAPADYDIPYDSDDEQLPSSTPPPPPPPSPPRLLTPPRPPSPSPSPPPRHATPPPATTHTQLREFLNASDNDNDDTDEGSATPRYRYRKDPVAAPTLHELEKRGEYRTRPEFLSTHQIDQLAATATAPLPPTVETEEEKTDVAGLESVDDRKRELLISLDMLRKKFPENASTVPELHMDTSLKDMEHVYKLHLRKIEIEHNVGDYRTYLIFGFMFMEHILSRLMRINMDGFTSQQMLNMRQYDRFLIEIGEKDYLPKEKRWPVELRLVFCIIIHAAVFVVSKAILNRTGANLLSMFNSVVAPKTASDSTKRRMKMPDMRSVFENENA